MLEKVETPAPYAQKH